MCSEIYLGHSSYYALRRGKERPVGEYLRILFYYTLCQFDEEMKGEFPEWSCLCLSAFRRWQDMVL